MKDILIGLIFSFVLFTVSSSNAAIPSIPQGFTRGTGITTGEPTPPPPGQYGTTKSIQQYGITWSFADSVKYGQFVNGDYWVVDPGNGITNRQNHSWTYLALKYRQNYEWFNVESINYNPGV